ncbi:hypothetical protein Syun_008224 [Stephania yunnanensis]|uniref:Uncharacterized protein n=1 Tax=Stephania yunnanensis TaxID=152371 RepID=A0AAP0L1D9_9MAGN
MASNWVRTITYPFRKARTFFDQNASSKDNKSQQAGHHHHHHDNRVVDLQGEVMACAYEDVQVMWSILDKSNPRLCSTKPDH